METESAAAAAAAAGAPATAPKRRFEGGQRDACKVEDDASTCLTKAAKRVAVDTSNDTPTMTLFRQFAATMDAKNDRHERLVKLSRDLTVQSKRVIFAAQRATEAKQRDAIVAQALQTLEDIRQNQIRPMAVDAYSMRSRFESRYARAYSPGMQEYIEAVSFVHYLATATLITQRQLEEQLLFDEALSVSIDLCVSVRFFPVTITDYLLGVTDLTGELMRFAIASVGSGNQQEPMLIGSFVRTLTQVFSLLTGTGIRDLPAKLRVMQSSLEKIEQVCYNITVRGSEIPKEMLAQAAQFWSSSSATTSGPGDDYAGGAGGNQNDD
ncbi:hypothetical protein CAOG_004848 [Capsaspora owczarzaki ATCC 30864]|uniref:Translin-associated protein X n=1 Tax=Capsaspora owczarzaki (strain ATCC 30864) TaxID=595528 RepID=A0A0D2X3E4_CAPO3|nr:hypothetical protein CAOG_004848 [Capsaspora owczarzaki ATCC 30864]